jgi:hypothetical protein
MAMDDPQAEEARKAEEAQKAEEAARQRLGKLFEGLDESGALLAAAVFATTASPASTEAFAKVVAALDDYKSSREAQILALENQKTKQAEAQARRAPRLALNLALLVITVIFIGGSIRTAAPGVGVSWAFLGLAAVVSLALVVRFVWPAD